MNSSDLQTIRRFRWLRDSPEDRIRQIYPEWKDHPLVISTRELSSNASFVKYVHHHQVHNLHNDQTIDIIEKSIRKLLFLSSQEARFHRQNKMLSNSKRFKHPFCFGVIDTPWESLIFTEYVHGKPPRMHAIAQYLGKCIAEQEELSHVFLTNQGLRRAALYWSMDFFRPWFLLRPRFNFPRYLKHLHLLAGEDKRFAGLAERFKASIPVTKALAEQAQRSPRCISHMDYLRKNLFVLNRHLHLIDWSEVKIGRVGFDGGAYLGSLFRRKELGVFITARSQFTESYLAALSNRFSNDEALRNLHYTFIMTALHHCLRPENIEEHRQKGSLPQLLDKYDYLLEQLRSQTPGAQRALTP